MKKSSIDQNVDINVRENPESIHYSEIQNNTDACWWKDPCLRVNVWHCIGLCGVTFINGYDGSLMNGLQSIQQWQDFLGNPTGYKLGGITAALYCPAILFSWIAEVIANKGGRRLAVWTGAIVAIIGSVINAAAINLAMYVAGRALTGVGISFCLATGPTLLQEIAHPRYRSKVAGFYTCIYYIASIISAWICFGTVHMTTEYAWRIPCLLQLVGPVLILAATSTIPESPRWMVSQGRKTEAFHTLAKCHANGDLDDPLVQYQFREIEMVIEAEQSASEFSYLDFTRTKANRHRLLILVLVAVGTNWVGNSVINYYLAPTLKQVGIDNSTQTSAINAGMQVWNLIISSVAALMMERLGRRFLWLFSDCGMFVCYIITMGLSGEYATSENKAVGIAVIPMLFLFFGSYDVAWTPLQFAYPVEILPFSMRMKGMALFVSIQDIAVTVNTFVNPIAMDEIGWKYYGVYITILAGYIAATYLYFPETRRLTIEQISNIFDDGVGSSSLAQKAMTVEDHGQKTDNGLASPESQHIEVS